MNFIYISQCQMCYSASPRIEIVFLLQPAETELEEDICLKMKRRAFAGYGIKHQQVCEKNVANPSIQTHLIPLLFPFVCAGDCGGEDEASDI